MGAFSKIFQRLRLTADTSVTTQTSTVIQADTTNASLVLAPNGTGAIIASVPDGTLTGGNSRGTNAVDLQLNRNAANEVASGNYSFIGGGIGNKSTNIYSSITGGEGNTTSGAWCFIGNGFSNTASTNWSTISGGQTNTASTNTHATVVGGLSNTSSGQFSISGGQLNNASGQGAVTLGTSNTASSNYSTISGGQSNTASTNSHATVVGGLSNTSSGLWSISGGNGNTASASATISLGRSNTSSGNYSFSGGYGVTASGIYSFAFGGNQTIASKDFAVALGNMSLGYLYGMFAFSSGQTGAAYDNQYSILLAKREASLTTAATTVLSLDGTGTTNLILSFASNRIWNVQIDTVAVVTAITGTATGVTVGDCYRETKQLLFKRIGGTSSIVGTVDTTSIKSDTSMSACAMTITAGASQEMTLTFTAPTFTGGGSVTCRVVSKVSLVEVAY